MVYQSISCNSILESADFGMIRIFIHGLTNQTDSLVAAKLGVDGIGFILDETDERYIEYTLAMNIIEQLPPMTTIFLQPDRLELPWLREMVTKLKIHNLIVPVSQYSNEIQTLGARIILTGIADRLLEFASLTSRRHSMIPIDMLFSMFRDMDKSSKQAWQKVNQEHHLLIPCDVAPDELPEVLSNFKPGGLYFEGGTESHTGLQDFPLIQAYIQTVHSVVERV